MAQFKSAKAWFDAHNGATVIKTVTGAATVDQWPAMVADYTAQLIAQGCAPDAIKETETALEWPGGFAMRPKLKAREVGKLAIRSADYGFTPEGASKPVYGDKKGATVEGAALVKTYPNGMVIRFEAAADMGGL